MNEPINPLLHYNIIYISSKIDEFVSKNIVHDIILLNEKKKLEGVNSNISFIQLIINSPGGYCHDGWVIVDFMEWSKLPVYTTAVGEICSMGLTIFMAGARKHRIITKNTSILSHRFSGYKSGSYSELVASRKEEDLTHKRLVNHYLKYTKIKTEAELKQKLLKDVDTWLTPKEAVTLGIADKIEG